MKITYFGHSCFRIETGETTFLTDPFITENPLASKIDIYSITCDHILLTHGHGDHMTDLEAIVENTEAHILSNYEIATYYQSRGFKTTGMNHGGWWAYPEGRIKYVNAIHSSSFPDGTYAGNPGGFVIEAGDKTLYHSGDTALTMDMKLIPLLCRKPDAAILSIGDHFTMGVNDAVIASDFIECDFIIGAHYDTFAPIEIDHEAAQAAFSSQGKTLELLNIGSFLSI